MDVLDRDLTMFFFYFSIIILTGAILIGVGFYRRKGKEKKNSKK